MDIIKKEHLDKNQLLALRKRFNLKQLDVAIMLGFTNTNRISKWEKGTAVPGLSNIFMLALIFNVQPQELYPELFKELGVVVHNRKRELVERVQKDAELKRRKVEVLLK